MTRRLVGMLVLSCAGVLAANAEPFWIAYEGNDFPENEGWTRVYGDEGGYLHGGAVRSIEDGALVIDSRRSTWIYDYYSMDRSVDPDPDELFVMRWRLRVDYVSSWRDPSVSVFSDDARAVGFEFTEDHIASAFEHGYSASFAPGLYHTFEFRSRDMLTYSLSIDDKPALSGQFEDVFTTSEVGWGDGVQGSASLAHWDYFRFGVIPRIGSTDPIRVHGSASLAGSAEGTGLRVPEP